MAKKQTVKLDWTAVSSSNVQSVAFCKGVICVRFHNGGLYSYSEAEMEVFTNLVHAPSVGKYLSQAIKGVYPYTKWFDEGELLEYLRKKKG